MYQQTIINNQLATEVIYMMRSMLITRALRHSKNGKLQIPSTRMMNTAFDTGKLCSFILL
jgi:hypothetical protein